MKSKYYKIAQKRVKKKKAFWNHFTVWLIVSIFFFILNMVTDQERHFPWWLWWIGLKWHPQSWAICRRQLWWSQKKVGQSRLCLSHFSKTFEAFFFSIFIWQCLLFRYHCIGVGLSITPRCYGPSYLKSPGQHTAVSAIKNRMITIPHWENWYTAI